MKSSKFVRCTIVWALTPLLICLIFPISISFFVPIVTYRYFVSKLAKVLKRRDLKKMLTSLSSIFTIDKAGDTFDLMVNLELPTPHLDINYVLESLKINSLEALDPDGLPFYPELTCSIKSWMGFLFYTPCKTFDIKNHVRYLKDIPNAPTVDWKNPNALNILSNDLISKHKWIKGRPFWEFIIVPNVPKDPGDPIERKSVLIFRVNHAVADGISIFKFLAKTFGINDAFDSIPVSSYTKSKAFSNILKNFVLFAKLPFQFTDMVLEKLFIKKQKIPRFQGRRKSSHEVIRHLSEDFPISKIKSLKDLYKVDFSSVLFAMITSGIRQMLRQEGTELQGDVEMTFVIPLPGHPNKLRNHYTNANILLPVREEDPIKRLKVIHKRIKRLKASTIPLLFLCVVKSLGSLPTFFIKLLFRSSLLTADRYPIILSNIFGPGKVVHLNQIPVVGLQVRPSFPNSRAVGYVFMFQTYREKASMFVASNCGFTSSEEAKSLVDMCLNELNVLLEMKESDVV